MKSSLIKNKNEQVLFFESIRKTLPPNIALVNVVADLLGISPDVTYRRIRGDKSISFEEVIKLCKHFNISIDSLTDVTVESDYIKCRYTPLDEGKEKDYADIIKSIADSVESIRILPENELIMSAIDISLFNMFLYKELFFFKIFSWEKTSYGFHGGYEEFKKSLIETIESIASINKRIYESYLNIPSTEIWTDNTIDTTLRLLKYHVEMRHFHDKANPLLICEQLMDLINTMQIWAEKGVKGEKNTRYNFYVSDTDIGNTLILLKNAQKATCFVRLYNVNGLNISNERFCKETEKWLLGTVQRAKLISGASEKERFKFFDTQKQKIESLAEKIQNEYSTQ